MTETGRLYQELMKQAMNERNNITTESLKELSRVYKKAAQDITKRLQTEKGGFTQAWLKDYQKYLNMRYEQLNNQIENIVTGAIQDSSKVAASVEGDFLAYVASKYNLDVAKEIIEDFYKTPDNIVSTIINGGFYKDNKSLSERVWDYSNKNVSDIQKIINEGLTGQRRYEDIIKDLSKYVEPSAKKPWDWSKVYPGINKKVDYASQRLLRTSVTQAFQAVAVNKMQQNKYIEGVKWNLSSEHFSRQVSRFGEDVCDEYVRNTHGFSEPGVFKKNEVPVQHPQCLCFMSAYIPYSFDELANKIAKEYGLKG